MPGPITTAFYCALTVTVGARLLCAYAGRNRDDDGDRPVDGVPLAARYARDDVPDYGRALPLTLADEKTPANDVPIAIVKDDSVLNDAISGLRNLGMTKTAAGRLARQVWDQTPNDITLADMMSRCLRALNK